jgi:hypothetical protein
MKVIGLALDIVCYLLALGGFVNAGREIISGRVRIAGLTVDRPREYRLVAALYLTFGLLALLLPVEIVARLMGRRPLGEHIDMLFWVATPPIVAAVFFVKTYLGLKHGRTMIEGVDGGRIKSPPMFWTITAMYSGLGAIAAVAGLVVLIHLSGVI